MADQKYRLRYCPRCAGEARVERKDFRRGQRADSPYRVGCKDCDYRTPWVQISQLQEVVDQWNDEGYSALMPYQPMEHQP